jgi:hypothetical protein
MHLQRLAGHEQDGLAQQPISSGERASRAPKGSSSNGCVGCPSISKFIKPKPISRETFTRGIQHDVVGISIRIQPDLLEFKLQAAKAKDPEVRVQLQADDGVNYG